MNNPTFQPYGNESMNSLYELLFCDNEAFFKASNSTPDEQPWAAIFAATPDENALLQIAEDPTMESRVRALAATKLHNLGGHTLPKPELLAVVIEVGLEGGLDVLAAFGDGTARYINQAEKVIIFDAPIADLKALISNLWQHSINVVNRIGPWDKPRLAPPETGVVRLSFLVSGQLYFGQGPVDVFFSDSMAGPVLHSATQLMQFLTENAGQ